MLFAASDYLVRTASGCDYDEAHRGACSNERNADFAMVSVWLLRLAVHRIRRAVRQSAFRSGQTLGSEMHRCECLNARVLSCTGRACRYSMWIMKTAAHSNVMSMRMTMSYMWGRRST
jgi:hypothetical protein